MANSGFYPNWEAVVKAMSSMGTSFEELSEQLRRMTEALTRDRPVQQGYEACLTQVEAYLRALTQGAQTTLDVVWVRDPAYRRYMYTIHVGNMLLGERLTGEIDERELAHSATSSLTVVYDALCATLFAAFSEADELED